MTETGAFLSSEEHGPQELGAPAALADGRAGAPSSWTRNVHSIDRHLAERVT